MMACLEIGCHDTDRLIFCRAYRDIVCFVTRDQNGDLIIVHTQIMIGIFIHLIHIGIFLQQLTVSGNGNLSIAFNIQLGIHIIITVQIRRIVC